MHLLVSWLLSVFLWAEKEEKRLRKESSLIRKLEKQKLKKENEQEVQQEERESKGKMTTLNLFIIITFILPG